ncbi:MAG: hypothetical protein JW741_22565, partial [Sedimentisphaerales bacterium]|nr:hypothetical protein [Sedimentisphaerales bacterium]
MMSRLTLLSLLLSVGVGIAGASTLKINFQSNGAPIPGGYLPDYGAAFGDRGNGWSYGWDVDNTANARDRNNIGAPDQRYDTVNHFRLVNVDLVDRVWEVALPNGTYNVFMVCGDPSYTDHVNMLDVEGSVVEDPDGPDNYDQYAVNVEVTDGRLTIKPAADSYNGKICFVDITSDLLTAFFVKATAPDPADGAEAVVFSFGRWSPPGVTAVLQWSPGDTAVLHDVYFGATPDLGPDNLVSAGQATTLYRHREAIESGSTYFWRVDEVESDGITVHEGDVWSFTTLSTLAWKPQPANGSEDVLPDVFLNWRPGSASVSFRHALYFGENFADVNEGAVAVHRGLFTSPGYSPGMLEADTTYYWRVDEVEPDGTVRRGNIWRFTTAAADPGRILREWWFGIDGKTVASLTNDPRYPSYPDGREFVSCMQSPSNWADQYGVRLRGWLFVPTTGFYTFLVEAKDEGQLLLSRDEDPAHAAVIVTTPVVLAECPPNWAASAPQSLEAGKRYYIEALMK